ncbi:MAG: hypothetical protein AAFW75_13990 [Cyanobacteria bacterium J06636_16]
MVLFTFATVFFPRLLSYFGAPSPINFGHLLTVPVTLCVVLATTRTKDRRQIYIVWEIITAILFFLAVMVASALVNNAGWVNIAAQFLLQSQPYLFLLTIIAVSFSEASCRQFRRWMLGFGCVNLVLALAQSVLIPMGLYPRRGGTVADNTAGVFASSSGSAGNYVSCTVSVYFALYLFRFKSVPLWIRIGVLIASLYQVYISDSKQVLLALFAGWVLLVLTKTKEPVKMILYGVLIFLCALLFWWALYRFEFMKPYLNWIDRPHIYGPEGVATQTKLAAFRIVPSHYHTPLNYLFGLGPGHTVTRLGGWMLKRYASLLIPLGATIHPSSQEVFRVVTDGWIAQESTIFFPLFTWAGIWGDIGFLGLASYLYLASIAWRKVCVDDFGKFMMLSTFVLGFILTQMEEPGHMLTVACLLGLSWHDRRLGCEKVP